MTDKMDDRTLEALKGSIEKWEAIVAGTGGSMGSSNCPLCARFLKDNGRCYGCPVYQKTRRNVCKRTPYDRWMETETDWREAEGHFAVTPEAKAAAQAELDFLRSLLPSGEDR